MLNPQYMLAPSPQVVFVDPSTGEPLAGGFVYCYEDEARGTLKPVYTLTGNISDYTYTALPNPIPLSAGGTCTDGSGNDIIPYWYPYDLDGNVENYYLVVKDSSGNVMETRQAWPNIVASVTPTNSVFAYNYVRNSTFSSWSNLPSTINEFQNVKTGSNSQYDFFADDWLYMQDDASQVINLSRVAYTIETPPVPSNSPYYLDYNNTSSGSGIGTINQFQQRYSSVQTLQGQQIAVEIWARSVGSTAGPISLSYTQFFGTGSPTPSNTQLILEIPTVPTQWTQFIGTVTVQSTTGTIGSAGDDAFILNINMPLNDTAEIQIASVRLEQNSTIKGTQVISNDTAKAQTNFWALYPPFSTGDVKFTIKTVADPGWLMMDDTTIGNLTSGANHVGISCFNLFSVIWNNIHSNAWAPIFDSSGVASTYGSTALADWNANKRLSLTKAAGRVFAGTGAPVITLPVTLASNTITFTDGSRTAFNFQTGTPFQFIGTGTLPSPLTPSPTVYYAIFLTDSTIGLATSLADAQDGVTVSFGSSSGSIFVTSTLSSNVLAQYTGEYVHATSVPELLAHQHNFTGGSVPVGNISVPGTDTWIAENSTRLATDNFSAATGTITASGGNTPFNITQPTTFMNVMIKL